MNITFFTSLPGFIGPIVNHLSKNPKNHVKVWVNGDQNSFMSALQTSDVVWFDFANEMFLTAQQMYPHKTFKCIVRVHSYEAFTDMPSHADWSRVDDLILVNETLKGILNIGGMWDSIEKNTRVHVIPNLVETSKFDLVDIEKKDWSKIAYLGSINYKKDPSLILPICEHVSRLGMGIYCGGEVQDLRYHLAFEKYLKNSGPNIKLKFEGHQKDVNSWLKDKMYILNTSLFESFNFAICEAMLCGCIPIIRDWHGAETIYPNIPRWNTLGQCYDMIGSYSSGSRDFLRELQQENRKFVIDNYEVSVVMPKIEKVIM